MNRQKIYDYVKQKYNTEPEYTWQKYPSYATLKHTNNKWYGVIMHVPKNKIGFAEKEGVDILNVKCLPALIGGYRQQNGFLPAYHMNKAHWLTILLDGSVDEKTIKDLIDLSYELTI